MGPVYDASAYHNQIFGFHVLTLSHFRLSS